MLSVDYSNAFENASLIKHMDPTYCLYNHVPRCCGLGKCSRWEQYLLKTWLRVSQTGSWWLSDMWTEWVSRCFAGENWAASEYSFSERCEIHGSLKKHMLHFRPVAALLMSVWTQRQVTVSAYLSFTYSVVHLNYLAVLSYERSFVLNTNCVLPLNWGFLLEWTNELNMQAYMAGRTEELKQNTKRNWLC